MKSDYIIGNRNLLFDWINWLSGWLAGSYYIQWITATQWFPTMHKKTVLFWCDSFRLLFALMRMKSECTANVVMILNWAKRWACFTPIYWPKHIIRGMESIDKSILVVRLNEIRNDVIFFPGLKTVGFFFCLTFRVKHCFCLWKSIYLEKSSFHTRTEIGMKWNEQKDTKGIRNKMEQRENVEKCKGNVEKMRKMGKLLGKTPNRMT